jgi:predicted kinase
VACTLQGIEVHQPIHDPAWQGAYEPSFTETVYAEVMRRAEVVLASGRPVVLDASFRSRAMRRTARELAAAHGVPFQFVECVADPSLCRARLRERARESGISDGRLAIFDDFCARFEPIIELPDAEHLVVDTGRRLDASLAAIQAHLQIWPHLAL